MRICALLLLLASCDPGETGVAAPSAPDAACLPAPASCGETIDCTVETRPDGVRVCGGPDCCQDLCSINGCGFCCARPH